MNTIQNLFQQAQLAEAAYANFIDPQTGLPYSFTKGITDALQDQGNKMSFGETQATDLVNRYQVVSQYSATNGGFSAALFFDTATSQYTFAIRGTKEPLPDLIVADAGIVVNGLAMDQIVDMYNYWHCLNTPNGVTYDAAKLVLVPDSELGQYSSSQLVYDAFSETYSTIKFVPSDTLADTALQMGTGKLAVPPSMLNVTGHSLGGHLSDAFTRLFPSQPCNAITINGAGYPNGLTPGLGGNALSNIQNLFAMLGGATAFDSSAITNIHGDGPNFVSMDWEYGLVQQGGNQEIYIETVTNGARPDCERRAA